MNIGEYSVRNKVVSWLLVVIFIGGGIAGFESIGKLEDPAFTIKNAKVITLYPGATAQQVQDEVTYHLEEAIQLMGQVKHIKMTVSRPGMSDILIEFKDTYRAKDFPDIYDELRRKLKDMEHKLPPGAHPPRVIDDFGDVYGIYLALTGEGYTYRDLKDVADELKKQLVLVDGVRKVVIGGVQREVAYIEISRATAGELGISLEQIASVLAAQNAVVDAGRVRVGDEYLRIEPTGEQTSVTEIGDLLISSDEQRLLYLKDISTITRAYDDVPTKLIYLDGKPALTLGISMLPGENVVAVGERLDARFDQLLEVMPVGMELKAIYNQPKEVDASVNGFLVSLAQALGIVVVVLLIFMGLKVGLIIATVLLITVSGTLWIMEMNGIELQRISLGALIIALGMLVDNAIVIAEGMLVRIQAGMNALKAAGEVVGKSVWALLGGTVIGILAFSAIGLSPDSTGEFIGSLFYVILISLLLSWVTAVSTTPLLCALLLRPAKGSDGPRDPYDGAMFRAYRNLVGLAVRRRWVTVAMTMALFVAAIVGFGSVKQAFFPNSNTPLLFVDVWTPEGSDIHATRDAALRVEAFLREQPEVLQTTTIVGGGDVRFTLVYDVKEASSAFAQVIAQAESVDQLPALRERVDRFMADLPELDPLTKWLRIGPGRDSKIEVRFSGPDAIVLRELSEQAKAVLRADPESRDVRDDWRQPAKLVQPVLNQQVSRQLGITREEVAMTLKAAFEGQQVGLFRDGIRLLPLLLRPPAAERTGVESLRDFQIWSPVRGGTVPLAQVVRGFDTVLEETVIRSRNRTPTIIASANPTGELATPLFSRIRPQIEALELPSGYALEWGGEYEDTANAQTALFSRLPMGFLVMIITSILLFGRLRQPLIIWLTVPLAIIGVTAGLLGARGAFDFMSLLGLLSLVGLLIKNAIVLIDEIDQQAAEGKAPYVAILDSAVSRLRPVLLAAATTILGMIPLLPDIFFANMAITIMGGLAFATVLTLLVVPALYAIFFRVPNPQPA
ncbi:MAG: AcrB/AcrD/AcrF family protein [Gammaproteobacteria bacterium]|nr:MAG: AcrB/AcrD/AcrF family protein [Gammaproteobacteria bacterium]